MSRGCRRGEEIQTKGVYKLFNKIIPENLCNLEKERVIQVQEVYRTPSHQDQNRNTPSHNHKSKHSTYRTKKEY
jgi:hypothetical protein